MSSDETHEQTDSLDTQTSTGQQYSSTKPDHMLPNHVEEVKESATTPGSAAQSTPAVVFPTTQSFGVDQASNQPASQSVPTNSMNTPGVLILQWLTYAFWGWTLIALYWLTSLSVQYFVNTSDSSYDYGMGDVLAYSLAAVVVLFVISMVCDVLYSKFEPKRKSGAATVIMVIHAVIFALCGIGSLVVAVFAVVNMLISGGSDGALTVFITASILSLLYAATLVRTLHPAKIKHVSKLFWVVMIVATLIIASLGIFGPAAYAQRTKNDNALEAALPDIADAISDYTNANGKLPESLNDSTLAQSYYLRTDDDVKLVMDKGLVQYTPKEIITPEINLFNSDELRGVSLQRDKPVYHYQLCATFDHEKDGYTGSVRLDSDQKYDTRPETSHHAAGKVCYDLQTDYIY